MLELHRRDIPSIPWVYSLPGLRGRNVPNIDGLRELCFLRSRKVSCRYRGRGVVELCELLGRHGIDLGRRVIVDKLRDMRGGLVRGSFGVHLHKLWRGLVFFLVRRVKLLGVRIRHVLGKRWGHVLGSMLELSRGNLLVDLGRYTLVGVPELRCRQIRVERGVVVL